MRTAKNHLLEDHAKDYWTTNNEFSQFRQFTAREVTCCLDYLHENSGRPWQHFVFIGDSRIRQQFYNLLKV